MYQSVTIMFIIVQSWLAIIGSIGYNDTIHLCQHVRTRGDRNLSSIRTCLDISGHACLFGRTFVSIASSLSDSSLEQQVPMASRAAKVKKNCKMFFYTFLHHQNVKMFSTWDFEQDRDSATK